MPCVDNLRPCRQADAEGIAEGVLEYKLDGLALNGKSTEGRHRVNVRTKPMRMSVSARRSRAGLGFNEVFGGFVEVGVVRRVDRFHCCRGLNG